MNERVLLVDDEPSVHDVVRAYLERDGFRVYSATSGSDGLRLALTKAPQVVVLDLMLPDVSGERICRELRSRSDVPILMLTAKSAEDDRVLGLELGADDYIVKPFSPREVVARIKAVLRRSDPGEPLVSIGSFEGGLTIDAPRRRVTLGGKTVALTASEFELLSALATYPGRVYSRAELLDRLPGDSLGSDERTVDAHVKNIRRKIESDPHAARVIETVHGVGYRLGLKRR